MALATADESGHHPARSTKYDYFEDLTVLVGPSEVKFVVYKSIICTHSDFFKTARSGQWKEASERLLRLPETDSHIFGVYLGWLYTGNLDFSETKEQHPLPRYEIDMPDPAYRKAMGQIMDGYVLGDMLQDVGYCNALVDEFIQLAQGAMKLPCVATLNPFWTKLPPHSTMRKLLVDYIATDMKFEAFLEDLDKYPVEIIKDVAKVSVRDRDMPKLLRMPKNRGKCFYHEHKEGLKNCT